MAKTTSETPAAFKASICDASISALCFDDVYVYEITRTCLVNDHGLIAKVDERLWAAESQRPQTSAKSTDENESLSNQNGESWKIRERGKKMLPSSSLGSHLQIHELLAPTSR